MTDTRRTDDERDDTIACACGCGATFRMVDDRGRDRKWLPGHYLRYLTGLLKKARAVKR